MPTDARRPSRSREWRGWHFFVIVAAGVAIVGGVWGVLTSNGSVPGPDATRTPTTSTGPAPSGAPSP